jgi:DNA-directed RNA polymerase subunit F
MIKEKQSLSMVEVNELLGSLKETDKTKDLKAFLKKYTKIKPEKAKKLREDIEGLKLLKLKPEDISKIVDILPEDAAELNKIFTEVTLDADETNKILDTIKQNK